MEFLELSTWSLHRQSGDVLGNFEALLTDVVKLITLVRQWTDCVESFCCSNVPSAAS